MPFKPYEELVGPIVLTYRGREYQLPELTIEQGLDLHAKVAANDLPLRDLQDVFLGDAGARMLEDRVPLAIIDRALWTAVADWNLGREAAEEVWNNGVPKELLDQLAKIAKALTAGPADAGSTTPPPASTSTTRTPSKRAPRSRGKSS